MSNERDAMGGRDAPEQRDDSVLPALLHRFHSLSPAGQLAFHDAITKYLRAAGAEIDPDEDLRLRRESVEAIRRVAEKIEVDPLRLTAACFDTERVLLGIELSSREVAEAWDGWKVAREAAVSGRGRETERQRELRKALRGSYPTFESYVDGVRMWLATDPPRRTLRACEDWARTHNANLKPGELPVASPLLICERLQLSWPEVVRVAAGEVALADAKRLQARQLRRGTFGAAHDLVGREGAANILGVKSGRVGRLSNSPGFPTAVLVIGPYRCWLRNDMEAYKRGAPVPVRQWNELRGEYMGTSEIAQLAGRSVAAVKMAAENPRGWVPAPVLRLGTLAIFDRVAAEAAVASHRGSPRRWPRRSG